MTVAEALALLSLDVPQVTADSMADACTALDRWKAETMLPAYRAAARASHPDRGGSDAAFVRVREARTVLEQIKVGRPRPQPTVIVIVAECTWGGATTTTVSGYRW